MGNNFTRMDDEGELKDAAAHQKEILMVMYKREYEKLLNYKNFDLQNPPVLEDLSCYDQCFSCFYIDNDRYSTMMILGESYYINLLHRLNWGNNREIMKHVLEHAIDIQFPTKKLPGLNLEPFAFLCSRNEVELVEVILKRTVGKKIRGLGDGIGCAYKQKDLKLFRLFVKYKINVNTPWGLYCDGITLCCRAFMDRKIELVKLLIGYTDRINPDNQIFSYSKKIRLVHQVCLNYNRDILTMLLEKRVDVEASTADGDRPVHILCKNNNLDGVKLLLDYRVDVEAATAGGNRPIHILCKNNNLDGVKLLLDNGATIEHKNIQGYTPVNYACSNNNLEIVELLIEKGANLNTEAKNRMRPIHYACQNGDAEMVDLLIKNHVNLNCRTTGNKTPMHLAFESGNLNVIKLLVSSECSLEEGDGIGLKPIHHTCSYTSGDISHELLQYLIEAGVDLNPECKKMMRPIHYAASYATAAMVMTLIEHGINLDPHPDHDLHIMIDNNEKLEEKEKTELKALLNDRTCKKNN